MCCLFYKHTQSFYLFELQPETIVVRPLQLQFGNLNSYEVADIPILQEITSVMDSFCRLKKKKKENNWSFCFFSFSQIALMTVTLFPIRLLIAAFMMLLAWPFAFIASVGRSETTVEPQCLWRRWVFFNV